MLDRLRQDRRRQHAIRELVALNDKRTRQANLVLVRAMLYGRERLRAPEAATDSDELLLASKHFAELDAKFEEKRVQAKELGIDVTPREQK